MPIVIDAAEFEGVLTEAVKRLGSEVRKSTLYHEPKAFEKRVCEVLEETAQGRGIKIAPSFHPHAFPDITANGIGIEVKSTTKDSWLSVGNSVFEGMRDPSVKRLSVVFGKFGGMPSVKWGRYEEKITHVRISHAPRFVLEMDRENASLFRHMDVDYDGFSQLSPEDKMRHVRKYSRDRLNPGERLWWLEDERSNQGLPVTVRLYMSLSAEEKIKLRAEGTLLFPQVVGSSRQKGKYEDVALYFLTVHGVFAPQTRDLFSAGSVAGKARGGHYLSRALKNIEPAMIQAAETLPDELFEEYWGVVVPKDQRLREWLRRADRLARDWKPSDHLFIKYLEVKGKK
ncbi:MAG: restriction endonuclease [Terriglobia bacterium]